MVFTSTHSTCVCGAGMILYNGQRRTTGADFISVGLVGGRLEFRSAYVASLSLASETRRIGILLNHPLCRLRFDVGSGMATIRSLNPIKLGEFHTVELYRNHTLGYIIVDGGEPINGSSQVLLSE